MTTYAVTKTELYLQDLVVNMDAITALRDSGLFMLEVKKLVPVKEEAAFIQGIAISLNLDLTVVKRRCYTLLDILSDVGGI